MIPQSSAGGCCDCCSLFLMQCYSDQVARDTTEAKHDREVEQGSDKSLVCPKVKKPH